jgi:Rps23 Pro-64 3,4-dihydroxylase Tpa1-like proline 4-hydroxylase
MINVMHWPISSLAEAWRAARPFPFVVLDGLVGPSALAELRAAVEREPHAANRGELYEMMASDEPPRQPLLGRFADALAAPDALAAAAAITGKRVSRVELRSYVYLTGSYLLPHTDYRPGMAREIAFAFYLSPEAAFAGGALELFACTVEGGEIVATQPALTVEPRADRLVLFDVGPTTLHQVREVTAGGRVSLAGWLLA